VYGSQRAGSRQVAPDAWTGWVRDCQTFDGAIIVRHDAYLRRLRSARTALLFGTLA